jgi:hypothetical protein
VHVCACVCACTKNRVGNECGKLYIVIHEDTKCNKDITDVTGIEKMYFLLKWIT